MQRHLYTAHWVHEFVKHLLCCPVWCRHGRKSEEMGGSSVLEGAGHAALPGGECGVLNSIEKEGKAPR